MYWRLWQACAIRPILYIRSFKRWYNIWN